MVKLLAIDKREGWAFVEDGGRLVLIRPPYHPHEQRVTSRAILARAIQDGDFEPHERGFDDWASLRQFVKSEVLDHAKQRGRSLDADIGDELIAVAPRIFIERLVDTIERDLFPANEWAVAQAVLESILLRSRLMKTIPELYDRVRTLLLSVREKQKAFKERQKRRLENDGGYKRLERRGELKHSRQIGQSIQHQGTMLS